MLYSLVVTKYKHFMGAQDERKMISKSEMSSNKNEKIFRVQSPKIVLKQNSNIIYQLECYSQLQ